MNIGRGRKWVVTKRAIDNSSDESLFQSRSLYYYIHRRIILKAQHFMQSMGFTMYCPYFDYVHIPYRRRFDKQTPPMYRNVGGKYFGSTPYEKLHRIEIQRRNRVSYDGERTEIHSRDYTRIFSNKESLMLGAYSSSTNIRDMNEYKMRRLMKVNIYRYL